MRATLELGRARLRKAATWANYDVLSEMAELLAYECAARGATVDDTIRLVDDGDWFVLFVEREIPTAVGGPRL